MKRLESWEKRDEHAYIPELKRQFAEGQVDRREFLRTATLLGLSASAAYAFAGKVTGEKVVNTAKAQAKPAGGTIRVSRRVQELKTPHSDSWSSLYTRSANEYLTKTHSDNITRPFLLEKWSASDDLKTWTLSLRKNVKWHNGRTFTADDAIWNIKHCLSDESGSSVQGLMKGYMLKEVKTGKMDAKGKEIIRNELWDANAVQKVDDFTVRLNAKEPQLAVPEHLYHYPFYMLEPSENGVWNVGSNGTGPFRVKELEVNRRARLEANKTYWGKGLDFGGGPVGPYLDAVELVDLGDDPSAFVAALTSRQVMGGGLEASQIALAQRLNFVNVSSVTTAVTAVIRTNGKKDEPGKRYNDPKVRLALRLAANNAKAMQIGRKGYGTVAENHHVSPIHPEYFKLPEQKRDIARAKQLLAEAGYPNGIDVEIVVPASPEEQLNTVQVVIEDWKEAGIRAKINLLPNTQYWPEWTNFPLSITGWTHRPLGVMVLGLAYRTGVPWNEAAYSNKEFDNILTQAEGILDAKARSQVVQKLETIMQQDGPIVQPWWSQVYSAWDKRLIGYKPHPTSYWMLDEWAMQG